jgi:hypothetical protein
MYLYKTVCGLFMLLGLTIAGSTRLENVKRHSEIIIQANIDVNHAADEYAKEVYILSKDTEKEKARKSAAGVLQAAQGVVGMLRRGSESIQKGQGPVKEREVERVISLRQYQANKLQSILKQLAQYEPTQKGAIHFCWGYADQKLRRVVYKDWAQILREQKNEHDVFTRIVSSKMPGSMKGLLDRLDSSSRDAFETTIRWYGEGKTICSEPDYKEYFEPGHN